MPSSPIPLIEAHRLTVRFAKVTALDGLDLPVPQGQVLAVLGPNGAGKTTFVRTVATLQRPSAGELAVRGHDVVREPLAVRRDIGLAGQFAAVEPTMTGRENLQMTARLFGHSARAARHAASTVLARLGLDDVAGRRAGTYSGGQRRRLDLAASLVGAPKLLLLDEPTTGLDPPGRREVWEAVKSLVETGTDVLLTTHYLEEANELADRVVVIDHGRVVASGTVGELKAGVGADVIDVVVSDPAQLGLVAQTLARATSRAARTDVAARRASATAGDGPSQLATVLRDLCRAGVGIEEIGLRRPSLDEAFAALTSAPPAPGEPVNAAGLGSRS